MFERYTARSRQVVVAAQEEGRRLGHGYIGTEHVLLGLLREGEGVAIEVFANLGISDKQIRGAVFGLLADHRPGRGGVIVPPGVRDYDERIAAVARKKDEALDGKDFERAAGLRDTENRLLAERSRRIEEWTAGVDVLARDEELDRLQREVTRLQNLLLLHGIQPGGGNQQTA